MSRGNLAPEAFLPRGNGEWGGEGERAEERKGMERERREENKKKKNCEISPRRHNNNNKTTWNQKQKTSRKKKKKMPRELTLNPTGSACF